MSNNNTFDMGLIGLGVMGRNLALNVADHGFSLLGHDRDKEKVSATQQAATGGLKIDATLDVTDFVRRLKAPRVVMLLVPAGAPVDAVIDELKPLLSQGDIIIDGGNSHFKDTERRLKALEASGLQFLGMGVSGGESGARRGPSMMPGGPKPAFERVQPILEAIAAKVNGEPCVAYLGPGACGHYVKMVHNGIEYALMQLLSESYDLMRRGLGMGDDELAEEFAAWNRSELSSFLVEITAEIFRKIDPKTNRRLVDLIVDAARQKGTGKWTTEESLNLHIPAPTIDTAVTMRDLSRLREDRRRASELLVGPASTVTSGKDAFLSQLRDAFQAAMILTFAQGMSLLREASQTYGFELSEETVARVWRGGCIIRATLLEEIARAYRVNPALGSLLFDSQFAKTLASTHPSLRAVVRTSADTGIPAPAFMASLSYYDSYRSARLPTNLIQAQRDFFGAHTYERVDEPGTFHTEWQ